MINGLAEAIASVLSKKKAQEKSEIVHNRRDRRSNGNRRAYTLRGRLENYPHPMASSQRGRVSTVENVNSFSTQGTGDQSSVDSTESSVDH